MNSLVKRSISGAVYVAVMVAALLFNVYIFGAVALFALVVMLHEFYSITLGGEFRTARSVASICGGILFIICFNIAVNGIDLRFVGLAATALVCLMGYTVLTVPKDDFPRLSMLYTGLAYIALPVSLLPFLANVDGSFKGLMILAFFIIIWSSDTGAYCFGCTLGRNGRKMCPSISPKKSWWGFAGGLIVSAAAAVLLTLLGWIEIPLVHAIVLGALMHCAGVAGDLYESQWKRSFDVKDSGNIIPGHGGLLDRFDSSIFAFPVAAAYLYLFNLL